MKENVLERNARLDTERKIADFRVKQQMDYAFKVKYAKIRAWEFYDHPDVAGSCYVAVGGLDSITLLLFLRSIGIDVPAISVSSLEDKSIQLIHKQLGVKPLKPLKSKVEVLREYGWPVISKEVAGKISLLQNPSEKNATVRHAIITGETGAYGGFRTGTRMKLAQKWLEIFGGYENENEGVSYKTPDFLVSDKCCYYLKEKPCSDYAKETGSFPYMGLMASEGGRRHKALMEIYGEIVRDADGTLRTTKAQRTGCSMCGFGVHMEKRPHRFDRLWERNPKEWEMWMNHVMQDDRGNWYGWGRVLDYIGVEWRDPEAALLNPDELPGQMIFDGMEASAL